MDTYVSTGKRIIDIGAGFGGQCRVMQAEYDADVIGLEYLEVNIGPGNRISELCNLPVCLQHGDATNPDGFGVTSIDACVIVGVLEAIPHNM